MMTIEGVTIPVQADELTIEQFDKLNYITKDGSLDNIEKQIAKFVYLGVTEEVFESMEFEKFKEYNKEFNDAPMDLTRLASIEVDGYTYEAPETIGVKDLGLIEKAWRLNDASFAAETCAILFKRTDLGRTEHYTSAHIKHKVKLFKSQKASLVVPYIIDCLNQLTSQAKQLNDEATQELERDNG